jgi:hypothetical protein
MKEIIKEEEIKKEIKEIITKYLFSDSDQELNISGQTRKKATKVFSEIMEEREVKDMEEVKNYLQRIKEIMYNELYSDSVNLNKNKKVSKIYKIQIL